MPENKKELIVVERTNGMYGGYEKKEDGYLMVFNTSAKLLFFSMKCYTDKGYSIVCVGSDKESDFVKGRYDPRKENSRSGR